MKFKCEVDVYSVELGTVIGGTKQIEAEDGAALIRKCGIVLADNAAVSQIAVTSRRSKLFVTDMGGFKFILDVMVMED